MFWRRDVRHLANAELQKRLVEVRRQSAEAEAWLDLLELALGESRDGAGWQDAAPPPPPERPVKTPLLFRAHLTVDRRTVRRYVHRLLERAELRLPRLDVAAFLEAAVCQDDARVDALAVGSDPHPLRVVAQMAVLPLLQARARRDGKRRRRGGKATARSAGRGRRWRSSEGWSASAGCGAAGAARAGSGNGCGARSATRSLTSSSGIWRRRRVRRRGRWRSATAARAISRPTPR